MPRASLPLYLEESNRASLQNSVFSERCVLDSGQSHTVAHNNNNNNNVTVQNVFQGRNNITCSTNCKYGTAATLYTLEK